MEQAGNSRRDDKDIISSLPDCLIHLIMSFLTAQEAVRTCILSKRWKNLWTSLPFLNFDLFEFEYIGERESEPLRRFEKFIEFVSMTLLLRESTDLHTLYLSCDEMSEFREYYVSIKSWILYALKHNLQMFDFDFQLDHPMPLGVFSCASLVDVSLNHFSTTANKIKVINLPCLRRLHLTDKTLYQDFLDKLFCGCPVLEFLQLEECCREFSVINSQSLKYLKINDCCYGRIIQKRMELIDTPKLLSISYCICPYLDGHKVLLKMPSLISASIVIMSRCFNSSYNGNSNILSAISSVQNLVLFQNGIKDLLEYELLNCPEFPNVKDLSVHDLCLSCHFNLLASFLNHCPNVEQLSLYYPGCSCEEGMHKNNQESLKIEPFKGKRLKTVEVKFNRSDNNFAQVVKYLQDITEKSLAQINMTNLEYWPDGW